MPVTDGQDLGFLVGLCCKVEASDIFGNGGTCKGNPPPLPLGVVEADVEFGHKFSSRVRIEEPPVKIVQSSFFHDIQVFLRELDLELVSQLVPSIGQARHMAD